MLVLEGILDVLTPDGVVELHANDVMRIAPDVRRQLVNRGPGRTVVVALGGSNEHDGRDGRAFASSTTPRPRRRRTCRTPSRCRHPTCGDEYVGRSLVRPPK